MSTVDLDPITSPTNCKPNQPAAPLLPPAVPPEGPYVITEANDSHAMYLDGQLVGVARTRDEAQATLDELMDEIGQQTRIVSADIAADRAEVLREMAR